MLYQSVAIVGPTACGKTHRAVEIARKFKGEILSADSRQVYRGMDIGTGKDLKEYEEIPYHLIDICEAGEKYNLHRYLKDFQDAYREVSDRGRLPVICGGTGMYVENALRGIKMPEVPENKDLRDSLSSKTLNELTEILRQYKTLHNTTDVDTAKRAIRAIEIADYYIQHPEVRKDTDKEFAQPLNCLVIGIDIPRDQRRENISRRLKSRIEEGMFEEVEQLLSNGVPPEDLIYYGLEYKYLTLCALGRISFKEMISSLEIAIHQFAKRQMTWFRGMEKRGIPIKWFSWEISDYEFLNQVEKSLFG